MAEIHVLKNGGVFCTKFCPLLLNLHLNIERYLLTPLQSTLSQILVLLVDLSLLHSLEMRMQTASPGNSHSLTKTHSILQEVIHA